MTESFWMKRNTKTTNYPTLQKETDAHIAIIGGGLTGITALNDAIPCCLPVMPYR